MQSLTTLMISMALANKTTLLFGSMGAIAETSELQRQAYNQALNEAGLLWDWDQETYKELLEMSGGKDRLRVLSKATGVDLNPVLIEAIHTRKTKLACDALKDRSDLIRPGVISLLRFAKEHDLKTGFVTTTYQPNIEALLALLPTDLQGFDVVIGREHVSAGKPSPECYHLALEKLGAAPKDALAIEDTAISTMAAKRAGIQTVATPGAYAQNQDLWQADVVLASLEHTAHYDLRSLFRTMADA